MTKQRVGLSLMSSSQEIRYQTSYEDSYSRSRQTCWTISFMKMINVAVVVSLTLSVHCTASSERTRVRPGGGAEVKEYCERETFTAQCMAPREVIVVRSAVYGRMRLGRCVQKDYGVLGCSADVKTQMETLCAGRYQCQFPITILHNTRPCPSELMAFLEASYECIEVGSCPAGRCDVPNVPLHLPESMQTSGYLSSAVTESNGCGSHSCPWVLEPQPGQHFNLTFYSFLPKQDGETVQRQPLTKSYCHRLATVVNKASQVTKDVTLCDRQARTLFIQTASSADIEIRMFSGTTDKPSYFLVHYKVVGCPDVTPPAGGWAKRKGDLLHVGCTDERRSWHLTCSGTKWIGDIGTCDSNTAGTATWSVQSALEQASTTAEGILAVVGLGVIIGIILGCSMLALVIATFKRRRRRLEQEYEERRRQELYYTSSTQQPEVTGKLLQSCSKQHHSQEFDKDDQTGLDTLSCCHTSPSQLHHLTTTTSPGGPLHGTLTTFHREHMYETPQFRAT